MSDEELVNKIGTATMMSVTRDVLLDLARRVREDEREKCAQLAAPYHDPPCLRFCYACKEHRNASTAIRRRKD